MNKHPNDCFCDECWDEIKEAMDELEEKESKSISNIVDEHMGDQEIK